MKKLILLFGICLVFCCSTEEVADEKENLLINKIEGFWWINEVPDPDYDYLTEHISIKFYDDDELWARENGVLVNNNTKEAFGSTECIEYSLFEENVFCQKVVVETSTKDVFCVLETYKRYDDEYRICVSLVNDNAVKIEYTDKYTNYEGEKVVEVFSQEFQKSTEPYSSCDLFEYEDLNSSCVYNDCELIDEYCSNEKNQEVSNNTSENQSQECDENDILEILSSFKEKEINTTYSFPFGEYNLFQRYGGSTPLSGTFSGTTYLSVDFFSDSNQTENGIWVSYKYREDNGELIFGFVGRRSTNASGDVSWSNVRRYYAPTYESDNQQAYETNSICDFWDKMNSYVETL